MIFDLIGVSIRSMTLQLGATVSVEFANDESCDMPIKLWFAVYGL